MTNGNSAERERFEKWCRLNNFGATRQPEGERFADYVSLVTERSWQAWQARAALSVCADGGKDSSDALTEAHAKLTAAMIAHTNAVMFLVEEAQADADAEKDAVRYRWMRDQNKRMHYTTDYQPDGCTDLIQIEVPVVGEPIFTPEGHFDFSMELDRAIDAAILATDKEPQP